MDDTTWAIIKLDHMNTVATMPPTRVCAVCGANELGHTGFYYAKDEFWLCPDCLKKLRKLLDKSTES